MSLARSTPLSKPTSDRAWRTTNHNPPQRLSSTTCFPVSRVSRWPGLPTNRRACLMIRASDNWCAAAESPGRREARPDPGDLGAGKAHPVGVGTARRGQLVSERIGGIENVAGPPAFLTVATRFAVSLAGLAVTGHRVQFDRADHVTGLLGRYDVADEVAFPGHGQLVNPRNDNQRDNNRSDQQPDQRQRILGGDGGHRVPGPVQQHRYRDQEQAPPNFAGFGGPAEKVDHTGTEDCAVEDMSGHPGEHAKDDGPDRGPNLVGAELGSGRGHGVGDVLDNLEAQADERAQDEPVESGPYVSLRQRDEQQQARTLGQFLGERGGKPGAPVQRPHLTESLSVHGEYRVVGVGGHRPGCGEAAPHERDDHQLVGELRVVVDAVGEPPEQRGVDGERRDRQSDRFAIRVVLARQCGKESEHADSDRRQISPECEVARLVEDESPAPARKVERDVARTIEFGQCCRHRFSCPDWLMLPIIRNTAALGSAPASVGPVATALTPRSPNTNAAISPRVCGPVTRTVAPSLPAAVTIVAGAPVIWTPRPWLSASVVASI